MMDDNTLINFGAHKGKKVANVPGHYLVWFYGANLVKFGKGEMWGQYKELMEYIEDVGLETIKKEG